MELLGNWKILLDEKREALIEEERELMMNLSPAYLKWKEETLKEGEQRGIQQVARNMLAAGIDPMQITQLTGLTLERIRQIQTERGKDD